ncbi:hypothetical protein E2C01_054931 [Portunus trituberculatus]|uniref:Uncharacterized protein n=1 Tax=Portunus trituberculatus TaxID=210409 RepID=A0A5B7GPW8_PORTR|nr:hypothetical protein [Portunus trituberculatus]
MVYNTNVVPSLAEAVVDAPMQTRNRVVTESSRTTTYSTSSGTSAVSPPASQLSETRRRLLHSDGNDKESSGMVYDPDLHTPSPRRSLRTVTSSSSETTTYRRMVNNGKTSSSARLSNLRLYLLQSFTCHISHPSGLPALLQGMMI